MAYNFDPELQDIVPLLPDWGLDDPVAARSALDGLIQDFNANVDVSGLRLEELTVPGAQGEPDVLVRAYDSKADPDSFVNYANKITNRQAADRLLKGWASRLRAAMDDAMSAPADGM